MSDPDHHAMMEDYYADRRRIQDLELEIEQLQRIRDLCINALMCVTGKSRPAVEAGPYACAVAARDEIERLQVHSSVLLREIERLRARLFPPDDPPVDHERDHLGEQCAVLLSENKRLRVALEWYADCSTDDYSRDKGYRASRALERL
jgi:hypothetical protein